MGNLERRRRGERIGLVMFWFFFKFFNRIIIFVLVGGIAMGDGDSKRIEGNNKIRRGREEVYLRRYMYIYYVYVLKIVRSKI